MTKESDEERARASALRVQELLDRGEQLLIEARQTMAAMDEALEGEHDDDHDEDEPED